MNLDKAFPKVSTSDFQIHVVQNWINLKKGGIKEEYCSAARLHQRLKPKRGKIKKETAFILWLILCIERPWEKNWHFYLCEKHFDKIDRILEKISEENSDYPDYPELRALRNHIKNPYFRLIVCSVTSDWSEIAKRFDLLGKKIAENLSCFSRFGKVDLEHLKVLDVLVKYGSITKRGLMRKLGINKDKCDLLLKKLLNAPFIKDVNAIKIQKGIEHNRLFISYTGPKPEVFHVSHKNTPRRGP